MSSIIVVTKHLKELTEGIEGLLLTRDFMLGLSTIDSGSMVN